MSQPQRIIVIGAGGQARDTAWLIRELARSGSALRFCGFVVSDLSRLGERDARAHVLGDEAWLLDNASNYDALALGIGSPAARLTVAARLRAALPHLNWPALVHPSVILDRDSCRLGEGVMVAAGALGSVGIELADFSLINIGVTLGHEAVVGSGSVVNHAASISGGVKVGPGVLIGTGARILQYLEIGAGATVGAGAVVTRSVPAGETVVGVPARALQRDQVTV